MIEVRSLQIQLPILTVWIQFCVFSMQMKKKGVNEVCIAANVLRLHIQLIHTYYAQMQRLHFPRFWPFCISPLIFNALTLPASLLSVSFFSLCSLLKTVKCSLVLVRPSPSNTSHTRRREKEKWGNAHIVNWDTQSSTTQCCSTYQKNVFLKQNGPRNNTNICRLQLPLIFFCHSAPETVTAVQQHYHKKWINK